MTDRNIDNRPISDDALDALLARASARPPSPLADSLRARLLADALAQLPPPVPAQRGRPRFGDRALRFWRSVGGAPGLAGLTAAGVAGVWIGATQPEPVAGLHAALWQGAALFNPDLADWSEDALPGFEDDVILAFLEDE